LVVIFVMAASLSSPLRGNVSDNSYHLFSTQRVQSA
jgi:hypothetical protein